MHNITNQIATVGDVSRSNLLTSFTLRIHATDGVLYQAISMSSTVASSHRKMDVHGYTHVTNERVGAALPAVRSVNEWAGWSIV